VKYENRFIAENIVFSAELEQVKDLVFEGCINRFLRRFNVRRILSELCNEQKDDQVEKNERPEENLEIAKKD